jgi:predicted DNA-binding transcriptional regulator AlpA
MDTVRQKPILSSDADHLTRLIREAEAADFIGYTVHALQNWRVRGGGPRFAKVSSRSVRYRRCDLTAWAEARLCANTSPLARSTGLMERNRCSARSIIPGIPKGIDAPLPITRTGTFSMHFWATDGNFRRLHGHPVPKSSPNNRTLQDYSDSPGTRNYLQIINLDPPSPASTALPGPSEQDRKPAISGGLSV